MKENIHFQEITNRMLKKDCVFGAVFNVSSEENKIESLTAAGNLSIHSHYFIASVTKLYVTAMILILRNENKLALDEPIINFFRPNELDGIHVYKGIDYTNQITVRHLISNQSGLRDYFFYEASGSKAVNALNDKDIAWTFDKVIKRIKTLKPLFKPGQPKKVNYSDTNYQILGEIIERVSNMTIHEAFDFYLFKPLDLENSFVFQEETQTEVAPIYFKKNTVNAPKYMASVKAEGGIVATAKDVMTFSKAFFNGFYFPKENLEELKQNYRMILFPGQFYFGMGIEKLWIPRVLSFKYPIKNILGFWGQTGSFAFYHEDTKLYFTGTINQASGFGHGKALKAIVKVIKAYNEMYH